ncbi:MAG: DUF397 domain-containing protein [Dactylosporangium sp.]|nr:DUF397 domain-containing protein [Dactylosporangium sp.]NNJ62986.1 DUF397 domain-containing protein [Dactylosporangium sp.]
MSTAEGPPGRARRSSFCESTACIEVERTGAGVRIWDSSSPDSAGLVISVQEWDRFLCGLRAAGPVRG